MSDPITLMDALVLIGAYLIAAGLYRAAVWWIDRLRERREQQRFITEWKRAMRNERFVWLRNNKAGDEAAPDGSQLIISTVGQAEDTALQFTIKPGEDVEVATDCQDGGTADTSRAVCTPAASSPTRVTTFGPGGDNTPIELPIMPLPPEPPAEDD